MIKAEFGGALRIEGHEQGGGYDVYIGHVFIGDASTIRDATRLGEAYRAQMGVIENAKGQLGVERQG